MVPNPTDGRAMCFLLIMLMLGPRAALFFYWLAWPARWEAAFDSFILTAAGIVLVPWATLMYVITAPGGVDGFDYVMIGAGLLVDIVSFLSSAGRGFNPRRVQSAA